MLHEQLYVSICLVVLQVNVQWNEMKINTKKKNNHHPLPQKRTTKISSIFRHSKFGLFLWSPLGTEYMKHYTREHMCMCTNKSNFTKIGDCYRYSSPYNYNTFHTLRLTNKTSYLLYNQIVMRTRTYLYLPYGYIDQNSY